MCRLSEKYAPKTLGDVVGQPAVVKALQKFCASPEAAGFLLVGAPGIGKSSIIAAVEHDLGVSEWDTYRYSGPELTLEVARDLFEGKLRFRPMGGRFALVIVEEFERCPSSAVQGYLKDRLGEGRWPRHLILLMSSNFIARGVDEALLERFTVYELRSDEELGRRALPRLKEIYAAEMRERGFTPHPNGLCNGDRVFAGGWVKPRDLLEGGQPRYSIRAALAAIERGFAYTHDRGSNAEDGR
jgi:replication-associated recombination protein RarA